MTPHNSTDKGWAERLLNEQRRLLGRIASGRVLDESLIDLCEAVARLSPGTRGMVLLADDQADTFARVVSPHLSPSFCAALEGVAISQLCPGTTGEALFHRDIASDESWPSPWRDLHVANGILGCLFMPILHEGSPLLGALVICFDKPNAATEWEENIARFGADIAGVAIARARSEHALRQSQGRLAKEVERMSRLNALGGQLAQGEDIDSLLRQILAAAADFMGTDKGNIQLYDADKETLRLMVHQGLSTHFVEYFAESGWSAGCGAAQRTMQRVIMEDVAQSPDDKDAEGRDVLLQDGIRAFQSTPLITRDGRLVGMLNNHFRTPGRPADEDLRHVDLLARMAADLIERRQAEVALRLSEAKYRTLFDTIDEGFCLIEFLDGPHGPLSDYIHVEANAAYQRHTGIPNVVGQKVRDMVPDEADGWITLYRDVLTTGRPIRFERELVATGRHLELSAFRVEPESRREVAVLFQDITKRKQAAEKLITAYERSKALSETLESLQYAEHPDSVARDLFGKLAAHLNVDTFLHFMVTEEGDALQLRSCAGIPEDVVKRIGRLDFGQAICGTVAQTRLPVHAIDIQHSDYDKAALVRSFGIQAYACHPLMIGERLLGTLSFASRTRTQFEPDEVEFLRAVTQFVAVAMDRMHQLIKLRAAKEVAEASSQAKDHFLAQLSHELRTPLTPVLMTATVLRDDETLPDTVRTQLAMMVRNISLEARLIDDLLDLTRITRGKLALRSEPCDLHTLLSHVVEIVREDAREKQITFSTDFTAEQSHLTGDAARLQQVFWNLLRNAVKFTPSGGYVHLSSSNAPMAGNTTSDGVSASWFSLSIKDNGIGFEQESAARIFTPFIQEEGHSFGGLGLGLAIAHAIVELHGGAIRAHSDGRGKGAVFTVELPGVINSPTDRFHLEDSPAPAPVVVRSMRLLLIEDHEATLNVLDLLLRKSGHTVTTASTVANARAIAASQRFDAVVSDLGLPDGTGFELMAHLRDTYGLRGIALSGYGMDEDVRRSREAGFIAHLVKPVAVTELRSALRALAMHE